MRLKLSDLSLPLALGLMAFGLSMPVQAGSSYSDRIYADSFGNLIVHSRAGYKRIVVGAGHLAAELNAYESGEPEVVYLDEHEKRHQARRCGGPVLLKGRSYMYGLEDGELPDLPGKWCGLPEHAAPGAAIRRVQP